MYTAVSKMECVPNMKVERMNSGEKCLFFYSLLSLHCSQNLFVMFVITPRGRTGIVDVANNQLQHICIRVHDNATDACRCFAKKTPEKNLNSKLKLKIEIQHFERDRKKNRIA